MHKYRPNVRCADQAGSCRPPPLRFTYPIQEFFHQQVQMISAVPTDQLGRIIWPQASRSSALIRAAAVLASKVYKRCLRLLYRLKAFDSLNHLLAKSANHTLSNTIQQHYNNVLPQQARLRRPPRWSGHRRRRPLPLPKWLQHLTHRCQLQQSCSEHLLHLQGSQRWQPHLHEC